MCTRNHGVYTLSDDPARLDPVAIHAYLTRAYWSEQIPLEIIERALRGSLCIGVYDAMGRRSDWSALFRTTPRSVTCAMCTCSSPTGDTACPRR